MRRKEEVDCGEGRADGRTKGQGYIGMLTEWEYGVTGRERVGGKATVCSDRIMELRFWMFNLLLDKVL